MIAALTLATLLVTTVPVAASDGNELYSSLCASCHGVEGAGRGSFPALDKNPVADDEAQLDSVIRSGKGIMPAFSHLSDEDIAALVGYVRATWGTTSDTSGEGGSEDGAGGGTTDTTGATDGVDGESEALPSGEATEGASLFVGAVAFESGAPPCVSCHVAGAEGRIAGSRTLGTDLTDLAARAGGAAGIAGMLAAPAFPVMLAAYEGHPLTKQERAHLGAYFEHLAAGDAASYPLLAGRLWIVGALGAAVLFVLMGLLWPRRRATAAERLRRGAR